MKWQQSSADETDQLRHLLLAFWYGEIHTRLFRTSKNMPPLALPIAHIEQGAWLGGQGCGIHFQFVNVSNHPCSPVSHVDA